MAIAIKQNIELAPFSSWRVGGRAEYFCAPQNFEELCEAQSWAQKQAQPLTLISGGTNVLISDQGIRGLVVRLHELSGVEVEERDACYKFTCWSGTAKTELVKRMLSYELPQVIFLAGIPGDVGGGVVMNAGVGESLSPREFTEIVEWIDVLKPEGHIKRYLHDEVKWEYRKTTGWEPGIISRVGMSFNKLRDPEVKKKVAEANKLRLAKQPLGQPNCGSVFKNPPGDKAGRLIEMANLKGYQIGAAQVSTKHANFIVNLGGASAKDIRTLIEHVQTEVSEKFNILLVSEVILLGQW